MGWATCKVHRKIVGNRCYRYLGFSDMAAAMGPMIGAKITGDATKRDTQPISVPFVKFIA